MLRKLFVSLLLVISATTALHMDMPSFDIDGLEVAKFAGKFFATFVVEVAHEHKGIFKVAATVDTP